ncbi:MAG TPA: hypothetical protein VKR59_03220 [Terriglobales bacterium]|nr:hypothetical protein [Terriglobales bacterium]
MATATQNVVDSSPSQPGFLNTPVIDNSFIDIPSPVVESPGPRKSRQLRSLIRLQEKRPPRTALERACRIALMESDGPASPETIYDRIVRRGSLPFFGYKRPLRAIASAMSTLVKRGEASLHANDKSSCWKAQSRRRLWDRIVS